MKNLQQKFTLRNWLFAAGVLILIAFMYFGSAPDKVIAGTHVMTASVIFLAGIDLTNKNLSELNELRAQALDKLSAIVEKAKKEKRNLTPDEVKQRDDLAASLRSIKNEIDIKETIEEERSKRYAKNKKKAVEMRSISLLDSIKQVISGNISPDLQKLNTRGKEIASEFGIEDPGQIVLPLESRAIQATDSTGIIPTAVNFDFAEAFQNENVLVRAGATYLEGLRPNTKMPRLNAVVVDWAGENDAASEGSNGVGSVTFTPKRLTAKVTVSRQLLMQTGNAAEAVLINDIVKAVSSKVESSFFGKHASNTDLLPDGIFTGVGDSDLTVKGAATRTKMLDLEFALTNAGRDSRAFIINEKGAKYLKSVQKVANTASFLLEDDLTINGNRAFITNNIPGELATAENEEGLVYGNFSELIIANFGFISIVADPFSLAHENAVKLVVNVYFDLKPRNSGAFAVGSILVS